MSDNKTDENIEPFVQTVRQSAWRHLNAASAELVNTPRRNDLIYLYINNFLTVLDTVKDNPDLKNAMIPVMIEKAADVCLTQPNINLFAKLLWAIKDNPVLKKAVTPVMIKQAGENYIAKMECTEDAVYQDKGQYIGYFLYLLDVVQDDTRLKKGISADMIERVASACLNYKDINEFISYHDINNFLNFFDTVKEDETLKEGITFDLIQQAVEVCFKSRNSGMLSYLFERVEEYTDFSKKDVLATIIKDRFEGGKINRVTPSLKAIKGELSVLEEVFPNCDVICADQSDNQYLPSTAVKSLVFTFNRENGQMSIYGDNLKIEPVTSLHSDWKECVSHTKASDQALAFIKETLRQIVTGRDSSVVQSIVMQGRNNVMEIASKQLDSFIPESIDSQPAFSPR